MVGVIKSCQFQIDIILLMFILLFEVKKKLKLTSRLRSLLLAAARRCTSRRVCKGTVHSLHPN
jgi:hypothetical protein